MLQNLSDNETANRLVLVSRKKIDVLTNKNVAITQLIFFHILNDAIECFAGS